MLKNHLKIIRFDDFQSELILQFSKYNDSRIGIREIAVKKAHLIRKPSLLGSIFLSGAFLSVTLATELDFGISLVNDT